MQNRIAKFEKLTIEYDVLNCNRQNTALYLVYGYHTGEKCMIYSPFPYSRQQTSAITTTRKLVDALYDYCYIQNYLNNINTPRIVRSLTIYIQFLIAIISTSF